VSQSTLALSLFFHIGATVIWIGGLLITVILVWPEVRRVLEENVALYTLLSRLRKRFYPISNLSLVVLITTGLFQMTADPNYDGVMQFNNTWSQVMLLKHIAIVGMALAGLLLQFGVVPALERTTLLLSKDKGDIATWERLRRREVILTWVSVVLGVAVLAFSAWATSI
jgi:uncharacterized membrane protein